MKKTKKPEQQNKKKLALRKETIRELSDKDLKEVAGGGIKSTLTGNCYCKS